MTGALRFLGRFWPHLLIAAVVMIALAKADANGAARATAEADRDRLQSEAMAQLIVQEIGRKLDGDLAVLARATNRKIQAINTEDRSLVQPIIQREIARDPSLLGRQCLTSELLRAVNIARGNSVGIDGAATDQRASPASLP